jgi:hypothetical protein
MTRHVRARFWAEALMVSLSGLLFVVTLIWRQWIEVVFGVDPDHHSGSFEWAIVAVLLVGLLGCGWLARVEWRYRGRRTWVPSHGKGIR